MVSHLKSLRIFLFVISVHNNTFRSAVFRHYFNLPLREHVYLRFVPLLRLRCFSFFWLRPSLTRGRTRPTFDTLMTFVVFPFDSFYLPKKFIFYSVTLCSHTTILSLELYDPKLPVSFPRKRWPVSLRSQPPCRKRGTRPVTGNDLSRSRQTTTLPLLPGRMKVIWSITFLGPMSVLDFDSMTQPGKDRSFTGEWSWGHPPP